MAAKFFGQFLLERGVISGEQLLAAVEHQKSHNRRIGTLAVERGLLDDTAVKQVLMMQRVVDARFGELAVSQGLFDDKQLEELLGEQRRVNLMLGEALIAIEALDETTLRQELTRFKAEAADTTTDIGEFYREFGNADILTLCTDITVKILQRVGDIQAKPMGAWRGYRSRTAEYVVSQRFAGDFPGAFVLGVSATTVLQLATQMTSEAFIDVDELALDAVAEFVNIIAGNFCAALSNQGMKVDLKPPKVVTVSGDNRPSADDILPEANVIETPLLLPDEMIHLALFDARYAKEADG
ncbi:MAG: chemotaxis protein CheX [Deltaproteobacteria bacterium]|nr:chemotaxis protein CheX [Deltaproteobacteria bacterium]